MGHVLHGTPDEAYFRTRYAVLREPLGMPLGSERLSDDAEAVHAWVQDGGEVVAVGRAHIIPANSDGSGADHKGPSAAPIPALSLIHISEPTRPY